MILFPRGTECMATSSYSMRRVSLVPPFSFLFVVRLLPRKRHITVCLHSRTLVGPFDLNASQIFQRYTFVCLPCMRLLAPVTSSSCSRCALVCAPRPTLSSATASSTPCHRLPLLRAPPLHQPPPPANTGHIREMRRLCFYEYLDVEAKDGQRHGQRTT
jgi:hypothetical protein